MKRLFKNGLLFFMMAALIGIIFMPGSAKAAGVSYTFVDGVVTISGSGVANDSSMWEKQKNSVTKVVIGEGITVIGNSMFEGCENLESVTFPKSLTVIGKSAFEGCESLTSLKLPSKIEDLENHCFYGCTGLTSVVIPNTVKSADKPFENTNISTVTFESGLKEVPSHLFEECDDITTINWTDTITEIGTRAFEGCEKLKSLTFPKGVTKIGASAFEGCESLTPLKLPSKVQDLENHCFYGCTGFTSVVIPNTVKSADKPFENTNISTVTFESGLKEVPSHLFEKCDDITTINWTDTITKIGASAFEGCESLTSLKLPSKIEDLENHCFYGCTGLTSIVIPNTVKGADKPFENTNISTVTFESGLKEVPSHLFEECDDITTINWAGTITEIGISAFEGCEKLKSLTFPKSVTRIGASAFEGCESLTSLKLPSKLEKLESHSFYGCKGITSIVIPKTLKDAPTPFENTNIYTVIFEDGLKCVPSFLFNQCTTLKKVIWGNGIKEIGRSAFEGCTSLERITMPWYLEKINYHAFYGNTKLKKITIYQYADEINDDAFEACSGFIIYGKKGSKANTFAKANKIRFSTKCKLPALKGITYTSGNIKYKVIDDRINGKGTVMVVGLKKAAKSVVIPAMVKLESYKYKVVKINTKAFYKKSKLKTVTIKSKYIKTIGKNAFKGIYKKATIQVPKAKYSAYKKMLKKAGVTSRMKLKRK